MTYIGLVTDYADKLIHLLEKGKFFRIFFLLKILDVIYHSYMIYRHFCQVLEWSYTSDRRIDTIWVYFVPNVSQQTQMSDAGGDVSDVTRRHDRHDDVRASRERAKRASTARDVIFSDAIFSAVVACDVIASSFSSSSSRATFLFGCRRKRWKSEDD